jgi:hypothetical protein
MRRKDRAIDQAAINKILEEGIFGVLSINGCEGYPYGIPLNYVYTKNSIFLHSALEGEKIDRLRKDNRVAFCVIEKSTPLPEKFSTAYSSVMIFGQASILEGSEKTDALLELIKKYSIQYIEQGKEIVEKKAAKTLCIKIDIKRMTGKAKD